MGQICHKQAHATKAKAVKHLADIRRGGKAKGHAPLEIYRCPDCGHWHLGHRPYSAQRRRAATQSSIPTKEIGS
jgi:ribosomal protein L32